MPNTFVEEYRKEVSLTGYPFAVLQPLVMQSGYSLPVGTIADASVYCETAERVPVLTAIQKNAAQITFTVGNYSGVLDLRNFNEVVPLYDSGGIFSGILVIDEAKSKFIGGWKDGEHTVSAPVSFCPRCIEMLPPVGVQRFITDSGEVLSGEVVLSGGTGAVLQMLEAPAGFSYVEVNFTGDPTYTMRNQETLLPVRQVECSDDLGTTIVIRGDESNNAGLVACNTQESNLFDDALRITGSGNQIYVSLGGT